MCICKLASKDMVNEFVFEHLHTMALYQTRFCLIKFMYTNLNPKWTLYNGNPNMKKDLTFFCLIKKDI